jgi:hypothetical protein
MTMSELLIGAGLNREKKIGVIGRKEWNDLTTLDNNPDHVPDVVHDLEEIPLPFEDNSFDEIHAYDVLEHTGRQGDWRFFFDQFSDFWRMLRPKGFFMAIVPSPTSVWAFGDPSHKRIFAPECLTFLVQGQYEKQVGTTNMSDFRFYYKADFEIADLHTDSEQTRFVLKVVK